jgi:hypothetical protein
MMLLSHSYLNGRMLIRLHRFGFWLAGFLPANLGAAAGAHAGETIIS